MEEEKWIKDEAKRKKEETKKWGVKISAPTLKTQQKLSQLNQTKLTQSTQKKKKKNLFQSFQSSFKIQLFNSKFSFLKSQCPNFKHKSSVFKAKKRGGGVFKSQIS